MTHIEKQLLENIFDALDRLFDRESKPMDLYALIYASEIALGEECAIVQIRPCVQSLEKIVHSGKSEALQLEETLRATNNLRLKLNELLSI